MISNVRFAVFVPHKANGGASWLGIAYLVSSLEKAGFSVSVKYYLNNEVQLAIDDAIYDQAQVLCFPILQSNFTSALACIKAVKKILPEIVTIAGNILPSLYPAEIMNKCKEIDYVSIGEGEETLVELLNIIGTCSDNIEQYLDQCNGIAYRVKEQIKVTHTRKLIENLDSIPFPSRDIYYERPTAFGVISSRGCNGHCTFCAARAIHSGGVRTRSIENVLEEILEIVQKQKCAQIGFYDATFCSSKETIIPKLTALYNGIVQKNIHTYYQINMRSEQIRTDSMEVIKKLIDVGLNQILVGFEAGNNEDLHLYGKDITVTDNLSAVETLKKLGCFSLSSKVYVEYGFINFHPYSSIQTLYQNGLFLQAAKLPVSFQELSNRMQLYEGAAICKKVKADGLLHPNEGIIIDPTSYEYQSKQVAILSDVLAFANQLCKDGINRSFIQHYRIWRDYFGHEEKKERQYSDYFNYLECLTRFCLTVYFELLDTPPATTYIGREYIASKINLFLMETESERLRLQRFQNRVLIDLHKIHKVIVY